MKLTDSIQAYFRVKEKVRKRINDNSATEGEIERLIFPLASTIGCKL